MPAGVPVATVGSNKAGGRNAALLAAEILATSDERLAVALDAMRAEMTRAVLQRDRDKGRRLEER